METKFPISNKLTLEIISGPIGLSRDRVKIGDQITIRESFQHQILGGDPPIAPERE